MKSLILLWWISVFNFQTILLVDFQPDSDLSNWYVVDDGVMGGRSQGGFRLDEEGHAVFSGTVSLENNGGFSSVRYAFREKEVQAYQKVVLRIKGDGKRYQFRVKSSRYDRASYIQYFETSGDWQTVEIPLAELYPTFRGRRLNRPNYPGEEMAEIAFLIGNKKAESFRLLIDKIELE
jgi:hypothetical protein